MPDIQELTQKIETFRAARNWAQFHSPKDMVLSLMLEAAELAEHFQWRDEAEIKAYVEQERAAIGEELADILYWVLLISSDLKIDIKEALLDKLKKNEGKYPVKKAQGVHTKYTKL